MAEVEICTVGQGGCIRCANSLREIVKAINDAVKNNESLLCCGNQCVFIDNISTIKVVKGPGDPEDPKDPGEYPGSYQLPPAGPVGPVA